MLNVDDEKGWRGREKTKFWYHFFSGGDKNDRANKMKRNQIQQIHTYISARARTHVSIK